MSTHDQRFFDIFILILGILLAATIGLLILARAVGANTQVQWVREGKVYDQQVNERLKPAGSVTLPGEEAAATPAAGAVADAAGLPAATALTGEQVFQQACNACHGTGAAGAPKPGDKAAWGPRIAQGDATLYKHAIEGFQGSAGVMPAKGGWANLSDAEVQGAVDYMVSQSR